MKSKLSSYLFIYVLLHFALFTGIPAGAQDMAVRMADSISSFNDISDYIQATAMKGFRQLWLVTGNDDYYQYIRSGADSNLDYYNNIENSRTHDIDPVNGGTSGEEAWAGLPWHWSIRLISCLQDIQAGIQ